MCDSSNEMPSSSKEEDSAPIDAPFDPTIEELIHDYDDERTLDEEEALAADEGEPTTQEAELSSLEKDLQMPLEEIMALYGYTPTESVEEGELDDSGNPVKSDSQLKLLYESNIEDSNILCITLSDDDEDCDSDSVDVFITTSVGPAYQVDVPQVKSDHEREDNDSHEKLLWKNNGLLDEEIEQYLQKVFDITKEIGEGVISGKEEAALFLLQETDYDIHKALKKLEEAGPLVLSHPNANRKEWPENETEMEFAPKDFLRLKKIII